MRPRANNNASDDASANQNVIAAKLLRAVPGLNVSQTSARDINITTRNATGTLATGQLALLDGRSLYQDFFGFVMWDFLPVNPAEIKQIEVIRGPGATLATLDPTTLANGNYVIRLSATGADETPHPLTRPSAFEA